MVIKVLVGLLLLGLGIGGGVLVVDCILARQGRQTLCERWGVSPLVFLIPHTLLLGAYCIALLWVVWGTWVEK